MNHKPLLQKALGEDWNSLPAVIQEHYCIPENSTSCVQGKMEIGYPNYLIPLIYLIHLFGGLVFKRGKQIDTRVIKTVSKKTAELHWQRTLSYRNQSHDFFSSHMIYLQKNELIEFVRFGFGLRLKVTVKNGDLIYRSHGHIWQYKNFRLTFPDWLLLGHATIIEHALSDQQFHLDFSIKHPLFGNSYWYHGVFNYCKDKPK